MPKPMYGNEKTCNAALCALKYQDDIQLISVGVNTTLSPQGRLTFHEIFKCGSVVVRKREYRLDC